MKKTVFFLMSFMALCSTQWAMATNEASFLPAIMSLLLDEEGPPPPPLTYEDDIHVVLFTDCSGSSCHIIGKGGYTVNTDIIDSYNSAIIRVDTEETPDQSLLLLKSTGQDGHGGGPVYALNGVKYRLILRWITDGALRTLPPT